MSNMIIAKISSFIANRNLASVSKRIKDPKHHWSPTTLLRFLVDVDCSLASKFVRNLGYKTLQCPSLLLMEEILHHLGCIKPCKSWDKLPINWCRISAINSIMSCFKLTGEPTTTWYTWPEIFWNPKRWSLAGRLCLSFLGKGRKGFAGAGSFKPLDLEVSCNA